MIDLGMVDWAYFQTTYFWVTTGITLVLAAYAAWHM